MQHSRTLARPLRFAVALGATFLPVPAQAAEAGPRLIEGAPFLGVLLSVALLPMCAPRLWHRRTGLICGFWAACLIFPHAILHGVAPVVTETWAAMLDDFLPFFLLLLALFIVGGGVLIQGGPGGTPGGNVAYLALGAVLAGVMGTTGAAMVLIHGFLRANAHRARRQHLAVFFIIIVANAGGATSPLGDPPLFLGFLHDVPFGWPLLNLAELAVAVIWPLLLVFYLLDRHLAAGDPPPPPATRLRLRGWPNLLLLLILVAAVLLQGLWHPGAILLLGQSIAGERLLGMGVYCLVALASLAITSRRVRAANRFTWAPIVEVGKIFAALFVTMAPVLGMLAAGTSGPLAPLTRLAASPAATFWVTGLLSAVLDNAPTYLVFFQAAGGDAAALTAPGHATLRAISAGAVFFGGLTYIGNAPNMMVRSIASHRGVRMPGFFGYLAWSLPLLLPLFALLTLVFFWRSPP